MNQTLKLVTNEIPYTINEDFKLLRTNLQFLGADKKVLLFTSTVGGEGKSTISYELARSLTEIEKRVLFVDCDLRKSSFESRIVNHDDYDQSGNGMSHYLSSQCEMDEIIYPTDQERLDIILCGPFPPNPAELLSHPRFGMLITKLREDYDYIIIDTAPVGLVADTSIIAPHCDGIILVMETDKIRYRMAQMVNKRLQTTKCPILGVILNKVEKKSAPYYHKYYYDTDKHHSLWGRIFKNQISFKRK